jgi:hypothetical protein
MSSPLKAHEAWSEGRDMVDERPRLVAPEIEEELFPELQKLAMLRDTQSVTIRPYSGPKSWTWELDRIEPEVDLAEQVRRCDWRRRSIAAAEGKG